MKNTNNNKKKGTILIIIGAVFITASVFLALYNFINERRALNSTKKILLKLNELSIESIERTPDYILSPLAEMPIVNIDNNDIIAIIQIPSIDLEIPILSKWSYSNLNISPCRYFGSAYSNNLVIAGHNYEAHFAYLENLKPGDLIILKDMQGNTFNYQVSAIDILPPTSVDEMNAGQWPLTLFTCNFSGTYRVTVRCDIKK